MKNKITTSTEFIESLIVQSWASEEFKSRLINDTINTLEKCKGKSLNMPNETSIVVTDQSNPNIIYLNIPPNPEELAHSEIDSVVGGCDGSANLPQNIGNVIGHALVYVGKKIASLF